MRLSERLLRKNLWQEAIFLSLFFLSILATAAPQDLSMHLAGNYSTETPNPLFADGSLGISYHNGPFGLTWDITADNRGTYVPIASSVSNPFSLDIRNAGFTYDAGSLSLFLGKLPVKDEIESPYSLFLSGASPSLMTGGFRYHSGVFSFSDRWIGLNRNIRSGLYQTSIQNIYRDRGAVLKSYTFDAGPVRIGYQDATIFPGSYFDVDIFANPVQSTLVQAVLTAAGQPSSRSGNYNSLMGFFGEYRGEGWNMFGQLMIDDFNLNRFLNPGSYQNPDKLAWSLGCNVALDRGKLGIYTAGATRYTFESTSWEFYSYTLYPGSAIISGGEPIAIPLQDQMLGYINGENNLAFMATWSMPIKQMNLETGLECVLSGSKSPTNPWHNGEAWASLGTQLLNDPVLNIKLLFNARISRTWGDMTLLVRTTGGYVFNRLNPVYPGDPGSPFTVITDDGGKEMLEPVFVPTAGDSGFVVEVSVGGIWNIGD